MFAFQRIIDFSVHLFLAFDAFPHLLRNTDLSEVIEMAENKGISDKNKKNQRI